MANRKNGTLHEICLYVIFEIRAIDATTKTFKEPTQGHCYYHIELPMYEIIQIMSYVILMFVYF